MSLISNLNYFELYSLIETELPTNSTNLIKAINTRVVTKALLDNIYSLAPIRVLAVGLNTPPPAPSAGDTYIVGEFPTGAWVSYSKSIVILLEDLTWGAITPREGFPALLLSPTEETPYFFRGTHPTGNWESTTAATSDTFPNNITFTLSLGKSFGKYTNGQTAPWAGLSAIAAIQDAAIEFIAPAFSSFSISGLSNILQVGRALSGNKTFTWGTTTPGNITPASLEIWDSTQAALLGGSLNNDGSEVLSIGAISTATPGSHQWEIKGINLLNATFNRQLTIQIIFPWFFGKVNVPGAAGQGRPSAGQGLLAGATGVEGVSTGTVSAAFNSISSDYIFIAIPSIYGLKTNWYVSLFSKGLLGPADLFDNPTTVPVNSPLNLWSNQNYDFYISNYQISTNTLELRN